MFQFESLQIKGLSFESEEQKRSLKNINIHITKDQCVAIVCKNKYEKDALSKIIQKCHAYENGSIIINNQISLNDISKKDWSKVICIVQEKVKIFPSHMLDNIILDEQTIIEEEHAFEDIHACIQEYGFENFIQDLPQGYATILGENGINLSDGQKRILALIRVLYKRPQLLILDEFTSVMDRNTEQFVLQLLRQLKNKMSIIFISTGLQPIKQIVDHIYVIENGETDK